MGTLSAALAARDAMRSPAATQGARDAATIAYSRAVDALVEDLDVLSERQVLGRLSLHLARREQV